MIPLIAEEVEVYLRQVLETGEPILGQELRGTTQASAQERYWLASYYPVRGGEGETIGVGAVVSDLTERTSSQLRLAAQYQVTRDPFRRRELRRGRGRAARRAVREPRLDGWAIWTAEDGDALELRNLYRPAGVEDGDLGDGGLAGRALKSGRAEWATDLPGSDAGLKSGLAFPILVGSTVCGVVELQSTERRERDEDLLAMSSALGSRDRPVHRAYTRGGGERTRTQAPRVSGRGHRVFRPRWTSTRRCRGSPSWPCRRSRTGAASPHSTTTAI